MKLSEAIRSYQGPQKFGPPMLQDRPEDGLCALAGAAKVIGMAYLDCTSPAWPWRETMRLEVPVPCECAHRLGWWQTDDLRYLITHLNDTHQWRREQIAEYVELYEDVAAAAAIVEGESPSLALSVK